MRASETHQGKHVFNPNECNEDGEKLPKFVSIGKDSIERRMDIPWDHGNLKSSEGADTQACDGAD